MAVRSTYLQRPYVPRYYGGGQQGGTFSEGMKIGQTVGTDIGNLIQAIQTQRENQRLNDVANQLMNTQNAPRAGLVDLGLNPQTGEPNVTVEPGYSSQGTQPATGGLDELKLRQAFQQQQLADAIKQAQLAKALAPPVAKPLTPYQQLQEQHYQQQQEIKAQENAQKQRERMADTLPKVEQEFDGIYGKGAGEKVFNALQSGTGGLFNIVNGQIMPDPNGEFFTPDDATQSGVDAQGNPLPALKPPSKVTRIRWTDLQPYVERVKRIQAGGGRYIPPDTAPRAQPLTSADVPNVPADTSQPQTDTGTATDTGTDTSSVTDGGSSANLASSGIAQPTTLDDYNAIPTGSLFIDGDGLTKRKYA